MFYRVTVSEKIFFDYVVEADTLEKAKELVMVGATQDEITSYTDSDGLHFDSAVIVSEESAKHFTQVVEDADSTSDNIKVSLRYYDA